MPRARNPRVPPNLSPEEGFAWLAAEQRRQTTRAGNHAKSGHVSKAQQAALERDAVSADIRARLAWAIEHPDRAAEVDVTLVDKTRRYDLKVVDGTPVLLDVTPPNGS